MFIYELLTALAIAFILSAILFAIGWYRPHGQNAWGGVVAWFVVLMLAVWVGGTWMTPFGPRYWEVSWAPFLLVGIFVFLLLLVAVPRTRYSRQPRSRHEAAEQVATAREEEEVVATAFGCFFWVLVGLLVIALLSRYTFYPRPVLPPAVSSTYPDTNRVSTYNNMHLYG